MDPSKEKAGLTAAVANLDAALAAAAEAQCGAGVDVWDYLERGIAQAQSARHQLAVALRLIELRGRSERGDAHQPPRMSFAPRGKTRGDF